MRDYYFKASLNIASYIMEIIISRNTLSIKNMGTQPKFIVKTRNVVSARHQSMIIIAISSKTSQAGIIIQTIKNLT